MTVVQTTAVQGGWDINNNILWCPQFKIVATAPSLGGLVKLNILQDFNGMLAVTYSDGSYTTCNIQNYKADYDIKDLVQTSTNAGIITCTFVDDPDLSVSSNARPYLKVVQYAASPRDFAVVQVGGGAQQVVSELTWPFSIGQGFKVSQMQTGSLPFSSTPQGSSTVNTNPKLGVTVHGGVPADTPVPSQRDVHNPTDSANTYIRNRNDWTPVTVSGTLANEYQYPAYP
jgi:hypothetical protein